MYMSVIEQAEEILQKDIGWIELDLDIDLFAWKQEAEIAREFMVGHRKDENHKGWRSCAIHGQGVTKTAFSENAVFDWTELSDLTPTITSFWKQFPSERFGRIRFMELEPSGWVGEHNDAPGGFSNTEIKLMDDPFIVPINIAITHPQGCTMHIGGKRVPWAEGKSFIVNITKNHSVQNNSNIPRIHLIAHCMIGNMKKEFANLVVRSYNNHND
jgi:hypothetical protein